MKNNKPLDTILYNKIKKQAKKKFKVFPSIYASSWIVQQYKKQGGKYSGNKTYNSGLNRWYKEEWINICELPKKVKCGRPEIKLSNWKKNYPYCRPSKKITKLTPVTYHELSNSEIKKKCSIKKKNPIRKSKPVRRKSKPVRRKSKPVRRKSKPVRRKSKPVRRKSKPVLDVNLKKKVKL